MMPPAQTGHNLVMRTTEWVGEIGLYLRQWLTQVEPHQTKIARLEKELKEAKAEMKKHSNLRHSLERLARRFYRYATRNRHKLLNGKSKTVGLASGSVSWKLNSVPTLICPQGEEALIKKAIELGLWDLLDVKLDKEAIKGAAAAGELPPALRKLYEVVQLERLVVEPVGERCVTIYPDGRVEVAKPSGEAVAEQMQL